MSNPYRRLFCTTCGCSLIFDVEKQKQLCTDCMPKPMTGEYDNKTGQKKKRAKFTTIKD